MLIPKATFILLLIFLKCWQVQALSIQICHNQSWMGNTLIALYQIAKTFLLCSRICSSMDMHLTGKEKGNLKKELILHREQCES